MSLPRLLRLVGCEAAIGEIPELVDHLTFMSAAAKMRAVDDDTIAQLEHLCQDWKDPQPACAINFTKFFDSSIPNDEWPDYLCGVRKDYFDKLAAEGNNCGGCRKGTLQREASARVKKVLAEHPEYVHNPGVPAGNNA